jgi:Uma2 family endonuclease
MSHPALAPVPFELVYDDGEPMENFNHVLQMTLLFDVIRQAMEERGRSDFFVGGNTFVYYSVEQARAVAEDVKAGLPSSHPKATFRGPDVFFVDHVAGGRREAWVAWEEGGRLPDLIVELLSPSTERVDRKTKMSLYAQVFRTRDYFLFDWDKETLEGYRLVGNAYEPVAPDRQGRLRSAVLGLDLGLWEGGVRALESGEAEKGTWVRLFDPAGRLIPTLGEAEGARADAESARADVEHARADVEHARADAERARADAAEAELKRLRSLPGGLAE